jgi:hypothetical protein
MTVPFMHAKGDPLLWCRPWSAAEHTQRERMWWATYYRMRAVGYDLTARERK